MCYKRKQTDRPTDSVVSKQMNLRAISTQNERTFRIEMGKSLNLYEMDHDYKIDGYC